MLADLTIVAASFAGLTLAAALGALWLRDRGRLARLPRARSGLVDDGVIRFDDGALPARLPVRGRWRPGPALVVDQADDGRVRVLAGLRGEILARIRTRAGVRRSIALAALAVAALAPAAGAILA